ncbi:DUF4833 domain-containing protein [Sediminibacterium salmoneum]|uniref:DUF4833 domain-containing protein n=1 Tax=Sediminibacterium salmoneum TaxID=426421 RepID=UPI00047D6340|nr:DUF4833 domain-containing protein [Sediminibacterium salmoneum]
MLFSKLPLQIMVMRFCFFCLFLLFLTVANAQENYPIPAPTENRLFIIQHSKNHNTYVYDANFTPDKNINENEPVKVYRVVYTDGGVIKPLTTIQRKLAYGVHVRKVSESMFKLKLVSYSGLDLWMKIGQDGKAFVETYIQNQTIILTRLFLKMKEGRSDLNPKLEHVIIYGFDSAGNRTNLKIIPE